MSSIESGCLLFKKHFRIFGFASMNDRVTGNSTALSVPQCKYKLFGSHSSRSTPYKRRIFLLFFLGTVKTYQNYQGNKFVFWLTPTERKADNFVPTHKTL